MKLTLATLALALTACDTLDKSLAKIDLTTSAVLTTGLVLSNARQANIDKRSGK